MGIGGFLKGFGKIAIQIAPAVLAQTKLAPIAPYVASGISQAELLHGASGPQKLATAIEIARAGIAATNAQAGKVLIDPVLSDQAIGQGVEAVLASVKAVESMHAALGPLTP